MIIIKNGYDQLLKKTEHSRFSGLIRQQFNIIVSKHYSGRFTLWAKYTAILRKNVPVYNRLEFTEKVSFLLYQWKCSTEVLMHKFKFQQSEKVSAIAESKPRPQSD